MRPDLEPALLSIGPDQAHHAVETLRRAGKDGPRRLPGEVPILDDDVLDDAPA
jgi:hypothetical protein